MGDAQSMAEVFRMNPLNYLQLFGNQQNQGGGGLGLMSWFNGNEQQGTYDPFSMGYEPELGVEDPTQQSLPNLASVGLGLLNNAQPQQSQRPAMPLQMPGQFTPSPMLGRNY